MSNQYKSFLNLSVGGNNVGSFGLEADNIHRHSYPERHGGLEYGGNTRMIDLSSGKSTVCGSFDFNSNINLFPKK